MAGNLLARARHTSEPGAFRLFFRWVWSLLRAPLVHLGHWVRLLLLRRSSVDRPRRWNGRLLMRIFASGTWLLALVFLLWLARSVYVIVRGRPWIFPFAFDPDTTCSNGIGVSCGAATGFVTSLLSLALASALFLLWRYGRISRAYRRRARTRALELVPTAGPMFEKVVGRDDLCKVMMEDLRSAGTRRPHVLIGGVGTGKTAVLVKLTEMLARRRAVPVPIRLRGEKELDFEVIARRQFMKEVNRLLVSEAEGEKIWRRLRQDGRIVVLADGLEEALSGAEDDHERDTKIRLAIHQAYKQRLPLLIASRPHAPLRGMDAAVYELEPLSEEAALAYLSDSGTADEDRRLRWIVETAEVTEAPLYLQITRELYRHDMLDEVVTSQEEVLRSQPGDRSLVRLGLLKAWEKALVTGRLYPEVPLGRQQREATVERMSEFALAGLRLDSLDVHFADLGPDGETSRPIPAAVATKLTEIGKNSPRHYDLLRLDHRIYAVWAAQLGLVEARSDGVLFLHSLIQAYLGSRLIQAAFQDPQYLQEALGDADTGGSRLRPGRELLIACVLHSRRDRTWGSVMVAAAPAAHQRGGAGVPVASAAPQRGGAGVTVCERLRQAAAAHHDNKALDIYAAALEIASYTQPAAAPGQPVTAWAEQAVTALAQQVEDGWSHVQSADTQTLEEAKLGLIRRFGESLRAVHQQTGTVTGATGSGYARLYEICRSEASYPIRVTAAEEIGRGGPGAFEELQGLLAVPCGDCARCLTERGQASVPPGDPGEAWRARLVSARLAPLLVTSIDAAGAAGQHPDQAKLSQRARQHLQQWVRHTGRTDQLSGECMLTISEEIALAQGFRHAANRRYRHMHTRPDTSIYLEEKALEMLKRARYWFTELTLIQALCLWAMPDGYEQDDGRPPPRPDDTAERWLEVAGSKRDGKAGPPPRRRGREVHPFVAAAADLAAHALETRHPERYLWTEESAAVARVGASDPVGVTAVPGQDLWIRRSMGWSRLDPVAQQLLADVLLLLNLAERGAEPTASGLEEPRDMEERLERADRLDLPPCITTDRSPLEPGRTIGAAAASRAGTNCRGGCAFELCPYPPKGQQRQRAELSEAFCRHQSTLLSGLRLRRRTARWQGMRARKLRAFWAQMADRARGTRAHAGTPD